MNGNGAALASLICGIAAVLLNMCGCGASMIVGLLALLVTGVAAILSIVGLIAGFMGLKNASISGEGKGMAIAGMVLGGLNLLMAIVAVILSIVAGAAIAALLVGGGAL